MSTKNVKTAAAKTAATPLAAKPAELMTAPPKGGNGFTQFVAAQKKATETAQKDTQAAVAHTSTPNVGVAVQQAAKVGFTHTEQNGRKDYTPHTIGKLIWDTADKLQAITPNTPVTSAAVRVALPNVKPASVSAGLSHWRKFRGTLRVKAAAAPAPVVAAAKPALPAAPL